MALVCEHKVVYSNLRPAGIIQAGKRKQNAIFIPSSPGNVLLSKVPNLSRNQGSCQQWSGSLRSHWESSSGHKQMTVVTMDRFQLLNSSLFIRRRQRKKRKEEVNKVSQPSFITGVTLLQPLQKRWQIGSISQRSLTCSTPLQQMCSY